MSTCFEPLKKMNVGLRVRVSRSEIPAKSSDSHCSDLVFGGNGLASVDIALQEVDVGVLLGERFEHWGDLVTWTTPRPPQVNRETVFAYCMKYNLRTM